MADFTFSTLKYERPDFTEVEQLFEKLVKQVQEAASYEGLKELLKKAERVQNKLMTACTIASIRHTLDTTDTYYEKEDEYINNTIPTVMPKFLAFDAAVMNSPFRDDIEKEYGKQYFAQKELNRKTFCEANIPLMQQEAITFVPFGVAVDEFQHICYANPELTPKERTAEWKKLEEKYMPWRKYDADDFFDRGGFWYHKLHIYLYPFYYINYTLTTMGAMEFKKKNYENHETAWQDYLNLCKCGGSMSYLETLRYANLSNPFEPGSVARAMEVAKQELMNSPFMR